MDPQQSLEQRIDEAAAQASDIVAKFSPQAGALCRAGAELEPVISGLVHMFVGLFKHHVKQGSSQQQQPQGQQPGQQPQPQGQPGQ
jgi:hypothetical protein